MTDFDKKLIEKANQFSRLEYTKIDTLIEIADTQQARKLLNEIRTELYYLVKETL